MFLDALAGSFELKTEITEAKIVAGSACENSRTMRLVTGVTDGFSA